ncbi:hypothetical protein KY285_027367 [Solanum tuberosum]|nr:hypothetical protein KY285_027367 [Solanum tuberosum]
MAEDIEVWDVICEGPYVPTMKVKVGEITRVIPKTRKQYNDSDKQLGQDKRTDLIDDADQKKENHDKATSSSEMCCKCDLPGHSIGKYPMHKADHRKIVKIEEGKDKEGDQVHDKPSRRENFFQAVKKDTTAWENSSSDSDDAFMAKSDEEDVDEKLELENKLHTTEMKMELALERNRELERDVVRVKEKLEKFLKWTNSSKILTNLLGQGNNSKRGLGCEKINPPYNPYSKSVCDGDDLLCVHCGRDGHLKRDCPVLKKYGENSSNYSKQRNRLKKGPGPAYGSKLKKVSLPYWTKDFLITLLSTCWELRLKWVPKAKK